MSKEITIESVYSKCVNYQEEERQKKIKKALEDGVYASYEDALAGIPSPSVMALAKNIVLGNYTSQKNPLAIKIAAIRYAVEKVMELDAEGMYSLWSTNFLKKTNLYAHVNSVIENAPEKIAEECFFDSKLTFFATVWPEEFEKIKEESYSSSSIFFGKGDKQKGVVKSLADAGDVSKVMRGKECKYGASVDKIVMGIVEDVVYSSCDLNDVDEVLKFLSAFDTKRKSLKKHSEIAQVVKARGYTSLMDFYFLNLPGEVQKNNLFSYLYHREKAELPHEDCIDNYVKAYYFCEKYGNVNRARVEALYREALKELSPEKAMEKAKAEEFLERKNSAVAYFNKIIDGIKEELKESEEKTSKSKRKKAEAADAELDVKAVIA